MHHAAQVCSSQKRGVQVKCFGVFIAEISFAKGMQLRINVFFLRQTNTLCRELIIVANNSYWHGIRGHPEITIFQPNRATGQDLTGAPWGGRLRSDGREGSNHWMMMRGWEMKGAKGGMKKGGGGGATADSDPKCR